MINLVSKAGSMKDKLYNARLIEVRGSSVHGYGVFAMQDIDKGQVLEECYYITLRTPFKKVDDTLKDYVFISDNLGAFGETSAFVMGYAMIYNYSINNNVEYKQDKANKIYSFFTNRAIKKDEELTIDYGEDSYSAKRIKENANGITWM